MPGFLADLRETGILDGRKLPIIFSKMARARTFYPAIESELAVWLQNYDQILGERHDDYGIDEEQRNEFKTRFHAFLDRREELGEAKAALRGAQTAKDEAKAAMVDYVETLSRIARAQKNVTPEMRHLLGLNPGLSKPTFSAPVPPADVRAKLIVEGSILVRWQHGANPRGTLYEVEVSLDGKSWAVVGCNRAASFRHLGQELGQARWYRVSAKRRQLRSSPSATVGVGAGLAA